MKLCVGATSRRVVEEAAKLQVHQIVASRRQVMYPVGYSGYSPTTLVERVNRLSHGKTQVVRDHGGPRQGEFDDDGVDALEDDVAASFDGLHIDVSALPRDEQIASLLELCARFRHRNVNVEVGGEHEPPDWNTELLAAVLATPTRPDYAVLGLGTHVWADQQIGSIRDDEAVNSAVVFAKSHGVKLKAHNMDWIPDRLNYGHLVQAYNLAPEMGEVESRAICDVLSTDEAINLLELAYASDKWRRWFTDDEGGHWERAMCALRYLLEDRDVIARLAPRWNNSCETYVRGRIRDAIING